jgi:hypothetical protein
MGNPDASKGHGQNRAEQEDIERWEHFAHYAHRTHLAAEAAEATAESIHVLAAAKMLRVHSQMAGDLKRMRRALRALENVAKDGGRKGAKARQALIKANEAFRAAQTEFEAEGRAAKAANEVLQETTLLRRSLKGRAIAKIGNTLKVGEAAIKLEKALNASRAGRLLLKTGRVISSKAFVRGLIVVGAAVEAVESYVDSPAQTTGGRVANAALGAGAGALTMANPYVAIVDLVAPKGYKPGEHFHGTADAVTAIGEGVFTGDIRAMDEFHKRSMQGDYGRVMKAASAAGEYWADKGIGGGLKEFAHEFSFKEFGHAIIWWVSHDDVVVSAPVINIPLPPETIGPETSVAHETLPPPKR